ncbi:MAG: hypothetical protein EXR75_07645 [Myxococcales bacterium]|nr:hypothetical protein [Myxococcales bacterium]
MGHRGFPRFVVGPLFAVTFALAAPAGAHHPAAGGVGLPETRVAIDTRIGELAAEPGGFWRAGSLTLELAVWERASVYSEFVLGQVSLSGGGVHTGPGDDQLGARVTAYRSPAGFLTVVVGAGVELPTGDSEAMLGGGHYMLTPSAVASLHVNEVTTLAFALGGHFVLAEKGAADNELAGKGEQDKANDKSGLHGTAWDVHSDEEVALAVGVARQFGPFEVSGTASLVLLAGGDELLGPVGIGAGLAVHPSADTTVGPHLATEVLGEARQRFVGTIAFERSF